MIRDSGKWLHSLDMEDVIALRGKHHVQHPSKYSQQQMNVDVDVSPIRRRHQYPSDGGVDSGLIISASNSPERQSFKSPHSHRVSLGINNPNEVDGLLSAEAKVIYYTNLINKDLNHHHNPPLLTNSGRVEHNNRANPEDSKSSAKSLKVRRRQFTSPHSGRSVHCEVERNMSGLNKHGTINISSKFTTMSNSGHSYTAKFDVNTNKGKETYKQNRLETTNNEWKGDVSHLDARALLDPRVFDDDYNNVLSWRESDIFGQGCVQQSDNRYNSEKSKGEAFGNSPSKDLPTSPPRYPRSSSSTTAKCAKVNTPYSSIQPISPPPVLVPAVASSPSTTSLITISGMLNSTTTPTVIVINPSGNSEQFTCRYNSERGQKRAEESARKLTENRFSNSGQATLPMMSLEEDEGFERDSIALSRDHQFTFLKQHATNDFEEQCVKARQQRRLRLQEDEAEDRDSLQLREEENRRRITDYRKSDTVNLGPFNHLYITETHDRMSLEKLWDRYYKDIMKAEEMGFLRIVAFENDLMIATRLSQQEKISDITGAMLEQLISSNREKAVVNSSLTVNSEEDNVSFLKAKVSVVHECRTPEIDVRVSHLLSSPTPEVVHDVISKQIDTTTSNNTPVHQRRELKNEKLEFLSPSISPEPCHNSSFLKQSKLGYSSLLTDTPKGNKHYSTSKPSAVGRPMSSNKQGTSKMNQVAKKEAMLRTRMETKSIGNNNNNNNNSNYNTVSVLQSKRISRDNHEKTLLGVESGHHSFRFGSTKEVVSSSFGDQSRPNKDLITYAYASKVPSQSPHNNASTKSIKKKKGNSISSSTSSFQDPRLPTTTVQSPNGPDGRNSVSISVSLSVSQPRNDESSIAGYQTKENIAPYPDIQRDFENRSPLTPLTEDPRVEEIVTEIELPSEIEFSYKNETTCEISPWGSHTNKKPLTEDPRVEESVSDHSETTLETGLKNPLRTNSPSYLESPMLSTSLNEVSVSPPVLERHNNKLLDKSSSTTDIGINSAAYSKKSSFSLGAPMYTDTDTHQQHQRSPSIKYPPHVSNLNKHHPYDGKLQCYDPITVVPYQVRPFSESRRPRVASRYVTAVCTVADKYRADPQNFARTLNSKFGRVGSTYNEDMAGALNATMEKIHDMEVKVSSVKKRRKCHQLQLDLKVHSRNGSPAKPGYKQYIIGDVPQRPSDKRDGVRCSSTTIFPSPYKPEDD